jgi:hypothetical protein
MSSVTLRSQINALQKKSGDAPDLMNYAGTSLGAFRLIQAGQKTLKVLKEVGLSNPELAALQGHFGSATSAIGVLQMPQATLDAIQSVKKLTDPQISLSRKVMKAVADVFGAIESYAYNGVFLLNWVSLLNVGRFAGLTSDTCELGIAASNYRASTTLLEKAHGHGRQIVLATQRFFLHKTAAKLGSVVLGLIGLVMAITGFPLISGLALSVASLSLTALAIRTDLLKHPRQILNMDRTIRV